MKSNVLKELQIWYQSQINGDWEHGHGVKIDTLDNPGWSLRIDLAGTALEGKNFESLKVERSGYDWLSCVVENSVFAGYCGARNLEEMIGVFIVWSKTEGRPMA